MASRILAACGASPAAVREAFEQFAQKQPKVYGATAPGEQMVRMGSSLMQLLQAASAQRSLLTDEYLSAEHVLLALLGDRRCGRHGRRRRYVYSGDELSSGSCW